MTVAGAGQHDLDPSEMQPITVFDVGARGQLPPEWHSLALACHSGMAFVLFEPDAAAATALRETYRSCPHVQVIETALYHKAGSFPLNATRHETCSSLREPDFDRLSRYWIKPIFEVKESVPVLCQRMDDVVQQKALPGPDLCKLDVQGVEYEVLLGMGALLERCLGFELETHIYPIYKGQRILPDIVALLDTCGFTLRDLRPQRHFDADYVEVNAFFAKREELVPPDRLPTLEFIKEKLGLQTWPNGKIIAES